MNTANQHECVHGQPLVLPCAQCDKEYAEVHGTVGDQPADEMASDIQDQLRLSLEALEEEHVREMAKLHAMEAVTPQQQLRKLKMIAAADLMKELTATRLRWDATHGGFEPNDYCELMFTVGQEFVTEGLREAAEQFNLTTRSHVFTQFIKQMASALTAEQLVVPPGAVSANAQRAILGPDGRPIRRQ